MGNKARILAFAGSARIDSFNKKLIKVAAAYARDAGADVTLIDLNDYPMPLYHGDLEAAEGIPENALKIKELMLQHDGFLISSPEYNSSISALLKNTIDWISRPVDGESGLVAFRGKVAGLMGASPGGLGGLRGLVHLRSILQNIGTIVVPAQVAVSGAGEAFDEEGKLIDSGTASRVEKVAQGLVALVEKVRG